MKKFLATTFLAMIFMAIATPALAFPSLIPSECTGTAELRTPENSNCVEGSEGCCKSCDLNQEDRTGCCCDLSSVERMAINASQIILGITGSLTLLMFVIGGVMYITSGGEPGKVSKATGILKNSVVGVAIVLLAGLAVQLILKRLTS